MPDFEPQPRTRKRCSKKLRTLIWASLLGALVLVSHLCVAPKAALASPQSQVQDGTLKDIQGIVKAEDGKLKFVADEDATVWNVMNPSMLKGYEGEHVELNVHLYPSKGSIHVHTVKKLKS